VSPLLIVLIALAPLVGAAVALVMARRLREAEVARAAAEAEARSLRERLDVAERRLAEREAELRAAVEERARRAGEEATFAARVEELARQQAQLRDAFRALSAEALAQSGEAFLQLARAEMERTRAASAVDLSERERAIEALVTPIRDGLSAYQARLAELERQRVESVAQLAERLDGVTRASDGLRGETQQLARALRAPNVRGRWGEVQLQRVCELAGMLEHCDFATQQSVEGEGGRQRPDLVVRLVGGKTIVVDAKTPLEAYLDAIDETDDDARRLALARHARQVRAHVESLSRKSYWEQFADAPELVVLFLPGESFYSAALEHDPSLIEHAVEQRVLIATPTTLIALLKALSYGWRQERLAENARAISELGRDLHARLATLAEHFAGVGAHLGKAVASYNRAVGSLESRVLVAARRFEEMGAGSGDGIGVLEPMETGVRELRGYERQIADSR
jgi:DNA recombination protein RmuC